MSDTIADMLTRLRNAAAAKHKTVDVKNSKICEGIAKVLKEEGYVSDFSILDDGTKQGLIRITIKYTPAGCRVYRSVKDVPKVIQGLGIVVLSTSRGVLSDRQARQQNIGGELLATIS
jgi:small subunit ribosomal protein S8